MVEVYKKLANAIKVCAGHNQCKGGKFVVKDNRVNFVLYNETFKIPREFADLPTVWPK